MIRQQHQRGWERWQAGCGFTNQELQFSVQERSTSTWATALSSSVSWGDQASFLHFCLDFPLTMILFPCRDNVGQPEFVFWFHNSTMINFQPGVTVETSLIGDLLHDTCGSGFLWKTSNSSLEIFLRFYIFPEESQYIVYFPKGLKNESMTFVTVACAIG